MMYNVGWNPRKVAQCAGMLRGVRYFKLRVARLDRTGVTGQTRWATQRRRPGNTGAVEQISFCPLPPDTFLPLQTFSPEQSECNGNLYLACQDLNSDRAAYERLHFLPYLLFLRRRGCVEGDFHHVIFFGLSGKAWLQSLPELQVGRGKIVLALTAPTFFPLCVCSCKPRSGDTWDAVPKWVGDCGLDQGGAEGGPGGVQELGWGWRLPAGKKSCGGARGRLGLDLPLICFTCTPGMLSSTLCSLR